MRRALYGSERLSALDLDSYLPDLIGPTEVLTDEYRKQLAKHLPARVEGMTTFSPAKSIHVRLFLVFNELHLFQVIRGRWCSARRRMDSASVRCIVK